MRNKLFGIALLSSLLAASCTDRSAEKQAVNDEQDSAARDKITAHDPPGSFAYDLDFLKQHDVKYHLKLGQAA